MKSKIIACLIAVFSITFCIQVKAQSPAKKYPKNFNIQRTEFEHLLTFKVNDRVVDKSNKYLEKAELLTRREVGDMIFVKIKLDFFKNSFMWVQVNGGDGTQVFIISEDKSIFYKGHFEKDNLVMNKCAENEIVSR